MSRRAGALARWGATVLAWSVILASVAVVAAAVLVPRLGGATPYDVLTGSMRPHLPPGTLVVSRPAADPTAIEPGTVVTYQLHSGQPTVVTHRVVDVRHDLTGAVQYQTQGDANDAPDAAWVRPEQVRGTLWYALPWLGRANGLLDGSQHQLVVYGVAALLAAYAGTMFAGATRDRRRGTVHGVAA